MSEAAGRYIVIEGNDGTGKSTQVHKLGEYLAEIGHEVVIVEEPRQYCIIATPDGAVRRKSINEIQAEIRRLLVV